MVLVSADAADGQPASAKFYLCRIEHSAGLVRRTDGTPTFSGQITLPPDRLEFQVKLSPYTLGPITRELCSKTVARYQQFLKSAPNVADPRLAEGLFGSDNFYRQCLATHSIEVTFPFAKANPNLSDRWLFRGGDYSDFIGADTWQWFGFYGQGTDHPTFTMGIAYDAGPVVVDGTCSQVAH